MIGSGSEAHDRVLAQPCAQAIDQRDFDRIGIVAGQEAQVAAGERCGFVAAQRDRPRPGRATRRAPGARAARRVRCAGMRAGAPSAKGTTVAGMPRWRTWRSCASESVSRTTPSPRAVSQSRELVHQPLHAEAERLDVVHGRRQLEAAREVRRRHERRAWIGHAAERAIDARRRDRRRSGGRGRRAATRPRAPNVVTPASRSVARVVSAQVDVRERDGIEHLRQLRALEHRLRVAGAREQERGARAWARCRAALRSPARACRRTSRATRRGRPPKRRRLPPMSATTASGGARHVIGVKVERARGELRERARLGVARRDRAARDRARAPARPTRAGRRECRPRAPRHWPRRRAG